MREVHELLQTVKCIQYYIIPIIVRVADRLSPSIVQVYVPEFSAVMSAMPSLNVSAETRAFAGIGDHTACLLAAPL